MDAEVMAGGLAAVAASEGWTVVLLHLTRGERGHPRLQANEFADQLDGEMERAAAALGARCEWPGIPAPLAGTERGRAAVADALVRLQPAVVVTHWRGSWHPSHVTAHHAVLEAIADAGVPVLYGENCEDLTDFRADRFLPIGEHYERWLTALRAYELFRLSEPGSGADPDDTVVPYWAYYTAAARVRGLQAGVPHAQALMRGQGDAPAALGLRPPLAPASSP
jgi:LmbE family N-acetylglucosaminyl deacetylase